MSHFTRGFTACIFDFDGVLVDTEPFHAQAKKMTLEHYGISYPEDIFTRFKGQTDQDFFDYVIRYLSQGLASFEGLDEYKRQAYLNIFDQVPLVKDAVPFLNAARVQFRKLGLATSATRHDFRLLAEKYNIDQKFDVIINKEDCQKHKPDPEPYMLCLKALQVKRQQALIIEDSPNGVRAGKAAGCTVAALTTAFTADDLIKAGADWVCDSFQALTVDLWGKKLDDVSLFE